MFKYVRTIIIIIFCLIAGLFVAEFAFAQAPDLGINYTANLGLANADPRIAAVNLIRLALTFLGIIAVVIVLYGGFLWMTAAGDPQRVDKAKQVLLAAVIGLIIILAAFLIVNFIINRMSDALTPGDGGCTDGQSRACSACEGSGFQTCGGGSWGRCDTACSAFESCCAWGCGSDCSVPPPFYVKATSPLDGAANVISNVKIQYALNRRPDDTSVNGTTFSVRTAAGMPVTGAVALSGRSLIFVPDEAAYPCAANPCGAKSCLPAGNYIAEAVSPGGVISFGDGLSLDCGLGEPCLINFAVGDTIDCAAPTVALALGQVCAVADNLISASSSDDSAVTHIEFSDPGGLISDEVNASLNNPFNPSVLWDGTAYPVNTSVTLQATAYDMDDHSKTDSITVKLRPEHCCNAVEDGDETGLNCGGSCAACNGAACGISLEANCAASPGNCDSAQCASGLCACGVYPNATDPETCQDKGYSAGAGNNCCVCETKPLIEWLSPTGGFCDGDANRYCRSDGDCAGLTPATCNTDEPNGAAGNLISIGGRNFGSTPGQVLFSNGGGVPAVAAQLANAVNPACGSSSAVWTDRQIIAVVPAGAAAGPVRVVESVTGSNFYDDSDDDFIVNTIKRPGLCAIGPSSGYFNDPFVLQGVSFSGASQAANFGNIASHIAALNVAGWSDTSVNGNVPNLTTGLTSAYVEINNINSNFINFRVYRDTANTPIIDYIDPASGPRGQYITIYGSRFGGYLSGKSAVGFYYPATGATTTADGFDFPAECQGRWWYDNFIIVKVPESLGAVGIYEVTVTNKSGLTSDSENFDVTAGEPGPGLCLLDPHNGPVGRLISAYGDNFGSSPGFVRFYSNTNASAYPRWTNQLIDTNVPSGARTGSVVVSNGSGLSNGLPFTVGNCSDNAQCFAGEECCGSGTYWAGLCRATSTCNVGAPALSGYGWSFTTADDSTGLLGKDCYATTTAPGCEWVSEDCSASSTLSCDPSTCSCQKTCGNPVTKACNNNCPAGQTCDSNCFCQPIAPNSCVESSRLTGQCNTGLLCPNSPGQCSPYNPSTSTKQIVGKCDDAACSKIGACDTSCTYNAAIGKCASIYACSAPRTVTSMGFDYNATCSLYGTPAAPRWIIKTSGSCPLGWTRPSLGSDTCLEVGTNCTICAIGFKCFDDGGGNGVCAVDRNVCPAGSICTGTDCLRGSKADCECCCRTGHAAEDCCAPLDCAGDCGSDRVSDTNAWGYCTGCADAGSTATVRDAACNCLGSSGKFCDTSGDPRGVCRDCAQLGDNADECDDHSSVCCIDAKAGENCRSGDGELIAALPGYCAYYNCQAPPNNNLCDTNPFATGTYRDLATCTTTCSSAGGLPPGQRCDSNPDPNITACDTSICQPSYSCFTNDSVTEPCGFCCCDLAADNCGLISPGLKCAYTNTGNCADASRSTAPDFGICCGCESDAECGNPAGAGCGTDTCCHERPTVTNVDPPDEAPSAAGAGRVCRNAIIKAEFSENMDIGSFSGNVILAGDYIGSTCPDGTQFLTRRTGLENKSLAAKAVKLVLHLAYTVFKSVLPPQLAQAFTMPDPLDPHVYCAVTGSSGGYHDAGGFSVLEFYPAKLLDGDRLYYAIVKGDANLDSQSGVLSVFGVGLSGAGSPAGGGNTFNNIAYNNSYIWSFRTLSAAAPNNGVCKIDHVSVEPSSYLFTTTKDELNRENDTNRLDRTFDQVRDADKVFTAHALSVDGQELSPVTGYAWDWQWSIDNTNFANFETPSPFGAGENKTLIQAQPNVSDGRTEAHAVVNLTDTAFSADGNGESGTAVLQIFLCENPWPPIAADGTWSPWRDDTQGMNCTLPLGGCNNTNYEIYYCRDTGKTGSFDDLPAILSDDTIIRGETPQIYKEAYFFREATPTATSSLTAVNTATAQAGGSATLNWGGLAGVAGYKIYWGTSPKSYKDFKDVGQVTNYTLTGLNNGTTYYFNITSYFSGGGESDLSSEVSVLVKDVSAPATPGGFSVKPGDGEAELSWTANTDDTASYEVYYGVVSGGPYGYSENIGRDTAVIIAGLTNGQVYYFAVKAVDAAGNKSVNYATGSVTPVLATCGNSVCDTGECTSGCSADCSVSSCCTREGCNAIIGENMANCPSDCGAAAPAIPPPVPGP